MLEEEDFLCQMENRCYELAGVVEQVKIKEH